MVVVVVLVIFDLIRFVTHLLAKATLNWSMAVKIPADKLVTPLTSIDFTASSASPCAHAHANISARTVFYRQISVWRDARLS